MFIYGNPVPPEEFIGRRRELHRVASRLAHHGQSSAIVGEHRTGKTSLLAYLMSPAGKSYVQRLTAAPLDFVYLDAQLLPSELSSGDFWQLILGQAESDPEPIGSGQFDNRSVESALGRIKAAGARLVVIIDEFDVLVHRGAAEPARFFGGLRSLTTRSGGAIALVLASRSSLRELDERAQSYGYAGSPYFNFVSELNLGPLAVEEADMLLNRASGYFTEEDRRQLFVMSGGFPYLLQAAAAALWTAYQEHSDIRSVRAAAREALRKETDRALSDIWRAWPASIRHVFAGVAVEQLQALLVASGDRSAPLLDRPLIDMDAFGVEIAQLREHGFLEDDDCTPSGARIGPIVFLAWFGDACRAATASQQSWEDWLIKQGIGDYLLSKRTEWLSGSRQVLRRVKPRLFDEQPVAVSPHSVEATSGLAGSTQLVVGTAAPVVFVSYSYDSEEHKTWVRTLAERLHETGIEVIFDQWDARPGDDLGVFMERSVVRAQRVLLVCSEGYLARIDSASGGVAYEKLVLSKEMIRNISTRKFIPLIRGNPSKLTPAFLGERVCIDFNDEESFSARFNELVDELYGRDKRPPRAVDRS